MVPDKGLGRGMPLWSCTSVYTYGRDEDGYRTTKDVHRPQGPSTLQGRVRAGVLVMVGSPSSVAERSMSVIERSPTADPLLRQYKTGSEVRPRPLCSLHASGGRQKTVAGRVTVGVRSALETDV